MQESLIRADAGPEMLSNIESTSGIGRILIASASSPYLPHHFPEIGEDLLGVAVGAPAVSESAWVLSILVGRLERLPVSLMFSLLFVVSAGIYLGWRWYSYAKFPRNIKGAVTNKGTSSLTDYDWGVIRGLRNRAFHLRTRSGVMLIGLIFLLFGAIHFVIFILPQVHGTDSVLIKEAALRAREAISREREAIFQAKYGRILRPMSQGRYWLEMDAKGLELAEGERIITASFAPDGRRGIVGGTESSVFFTEDGGRTWSRLTNLPLKESEREWVFSVDFGVNDDSKTMLVLSTEGSVFVTGDEGRTWTQPGGLEGKKIVRVRLTPDGRRGIAGYATSAVFFTTDGGRTWSPPTDLTEKGSEPEYVATVDFGVHDSSKRMLVVGHKGSAFVIRDEDVDWTSPEGLKLNKSEGETIITASFTPDRRRGIAGSNMSKVFFTKDGGWTWDQPDDPPLKESGEYATMVNFNGDSETMLVASNEGSVFVTRDKGKTWTSPDELEGNMIRTVRFAPDRQRGIAGSNEGAVFFTTDGGWTWTRTEGFDSATKELVSVRAIQEKRTKERPFDRQTGSKSPSEDKDGARYSFLMMASDGVYILKTHPVEPEQSLISIQPRVRNDDVLRRSVIGKDILTMSPQESPGPRSNPGKGGENGRLIDLTLMRIASMTILFFLVQLLVRLYQYNLRLASFLDSRADAVLLAQTFAPDGKIPFDDLVRSMAPDDYDFKPQPRPLHEETLKRLLLQRNPQATKSD